jgi:hypothetical protein
MVFAAAMIAYLSTSWPGLDPAIHEAVLRGTTLRLRAQSLIMDCRVKPGNDDGEPVNAK